jgi:hypothetical protein
MRPSCRGNSKTIKVATLSLYKHLWIITCLRFIRGRKKEERKKKHTTPSLSQIQEETKPDAQRMIDAMEGPVREGHHLSNMTPHPRGVSIFSTIPTSHTNVHHSEERKEIRYSPLKSFFSCLVFVSRPNET